LHYADVLADANFRSLVLLAVAYAALRLCERMPWRQRTWASGWSAVRALYVPFEVRHLMHQTTVLGVMVWPSTCWWSLICFEFGVGAQAPLPEVCDAGQTSQWHLNPFPLPHAVFASRPA